MAKEKKRIGKNEQLLLDALKLTLSADAGEMRQLIDMNEDVVALAEKHSVLPLIYSPMYKCKDSMPSQAYEQMERQTDRLVFANYRLYFETYRLVAELEKEGIIATVLKGVAAASFYPVPEYRKSGDIDILINDLHQTEKTVEVMEGLGYRVTERQEALHQIVMRNDKGIIVELHIMLSEPFDNTKINDFLASLFADIAKHRTYKEILSFQFPILDDDYQAFELLVHMLQHFLRRGFGIKLLCDWVYYWNEFAKTKHKEDAGRYMELIETCGIAGFSDIVSATCFFHLGLSEEAYDILTKGNRRRRMDYDTVEMFLLDALQGGEFGDDDKGRMVVLRNASFKSYAIEFHHQMHLNFPAAGKHMFLWPALWTITLCKFLYNNQKVRKISSREIFRKAEDRSHIMEKIKLWE